MKRMIAVLLAAALLAFSSACAQEKPDPVPGLSGVALYNDFISNLHSGEYHRIQYGMQSWYDFISAESTTVRFSENPAGQRELLYRTRNPMVIWHYPAFDYYDGETYYYKYRNDWFVDTYARYDSARKSDFVGIRDSFFTGNDVVSDHVYPEGKGYRVECVIQSKDKSSYYSMVAKIDAEYQFSQIIIKLYYYNFDQHAYEHWTTYRFDYKDVNEEFRIERPEDLISDKIINQ